MKINANKFEIKISDFVMVMSFTDDDGRTCVTPIDLKKLTEIVEFGGYDLVGDNGGVLRYERGAE